MDSPNQFRRWTEEMKCSVREQRIDLIEALKICIGFVMNILVDKSVFNDTEDILQNTVSFSFLIFFPFYVDLSSLFSQKQ